MDADHADRGPDERVKDAKPSDFDDPNEFFDNLFSEALEKLRDNGFEESDAAERAVEMLRAVIESAAAGHAESLESNGHTYVEEAAEYRVGFAERLREHWGEPLDLFELFAAACEEAGALFARRNRSQIGARDILLDVLIQLNGQAVRIRTAREVHTLLSAGFPLGAHSLSRTMHELSVRAAVLAQFAMDEERADLAERFVLHADVINYKDAVVYQRNAEALGYEKFRDEEMAELKSRHDELIERFEPAFGSPYGWAINLPGLPKPRRPTLEHLEALVNLDHFRGIYSWSSHFVHADAKSLHLSRVERGGSSAILTNATNIMLADPAQYTLLSLYQVFVSMVTSAETPAQYDHLLCLSLRIMLDKAWDLFLVGEEAVDAAEERLQAELAESGLQFDLVHGEVPLDPTNLQDRGGPPASPAPGTASGRCGSRGGHDA